MIKKSGVVINEVELHSLIRLSDRQAHAYATPPTPR